MKIDSRTLDHVEEQAETIIDDIVVALLYVHGTLTLAMAAFGGLLFVAVKMGWLR